MVGDAGIFLLHSKYVSSAGTLLYIVNMSHRSCVHTDLCRSVFFITRFAFGVLLAPKLGETRILPSLGVTWISPIAIQQRLLVVPWQELEQHQIHQTHSNTPISGYYLYSRSICKSRYIRRLNSSFTKSKSLVVSKC
jgi:hypothetical protein